MARQQHQVFLSWRDRRRRQMLQHFVADARRILRRRSLSRPLPIPRWRAESCNYACARYSSGNPPRWPAEAGFTCTTYCWIDEPSLEARYLSSARNGQETESGEDLRVFLDDDRGAVHQLQLFIHRHGERILLECGCPAVGVCFGGGKLDWRWPAAPSWPWPPPPPRARFARSLPRVTSGDAANPHCPLAITRTPKPKLC